MPSSNVSGSSSGNGWRLSKRGQRQPSSSVERMQKSYWQNPASLLQATGTSLRNFPHQTMSHPVSFPWAMNSPTQMRRYSAGRPTMLPGVSLVNVGCTLSKSANNFARQRNFVGHGRPHPLISRRRLCRNARSSRSGAKNCTPATPTLLTCPHQMGRSTLLSPSLLA